MPTAPRITVKVRTPTSTLPPKLDIQSGRSSNKHSSVSSLISTSSSTRVSSTVPLPPSQRRSNADFQSLPSFGHLVAAVIGQQSSTPRRMSGIRAQHKRYAEQDGVLAATDPGHPAHAASRIRRRDKSRRHSASRATARRRGRSSRNRHAQGQGARH